MTVTCAVACCTRVLWHQTKQQSDGVAALPTANALRGNKLKIVLSADVWQE